MSWGPRAADVDGTSNLHEDPYQMMPFESGQYIRGYIDQMWVMVRMQHVIKPFLKILRNMPFQAGPSLSASNLG